MPQQDESRDIRPDDCRLRVLLVDDDEDDALLARELLTEIPGCHYELEWAASYEAGLAALREDRHDVYLFDYRLGPHTGLELLAEAVARDARAPVILLTGQGERATDLEAMRAGAADFLVKGRIDAALLERAIRYAVERKRDRDALRQLHAKLEERVRERTAELERALERERRTTVRLQQVAAASLTMNAAEGVEAVLHVLADEARRLIPARAAVSSLHAGPRHGVAQTAAAGAPDAGADADGVAEAVCRTNRPARRGRAWLAAPLVGRDGRNLGLVRLADRAEGEFTEDDEAILVQLAAVAAVALENNRLVEALRDADRRKDEFLAMLAHELRNPLAPVRNSLHILRMKCAGDPTLERTGEMMTRQVDHMVRLVDDLLDVSRITRGKIRLQKEPADLASVVLRAVEASRPFIDSRRHDLRVSVPRTPLRVQADVTRMAQVLTNLLNNAAKFTPEAGTIWLAVERQNGDVVVRVRDSGVGIPPEMLPTIFDLFVQAEGTLDRSQGGLGIGLTLVKTLVEMHDGSVRAESAGPGRGSEFEVRLPLLTVAPAPAPAPEAGAAGAPRRHILVVDDNRDSADSMTLLLTMLGNDVRTAYDGRQALALLPEYRPDLILLDIGLPGVSGYDVLRQVRQEPRLGAVAVAALTGYGGEDDRRRTAEAGFDYHLVKPVDPLVLQDLLARLGPPHRG